MEISRIKKASVRCPNCDAPQQVNQYIVLNQKEYPKLKRKLIDTSFFEQHCPKCKKTFTMFYPFIYIDESTNTFFSIGLSENAFDDMIKQSYRSVNDMLAFMKRMNESKIRRRICDMYELSEKIALLQSHYDDRMIEIMKFHMIKRLQKNGEDIQQLYYRNTERGPHLLAVRSDGSIGIIPFEEMWYQAIVKSYRNLSMVKEERLMKIDQNWAKSLIRPLNIEEEGEGISIQ